MAHIYRFFCIFFFFFQAEDGIRDRNVTGVQTCALPILSPAATVSADGVTVTVATESPGGGGGGNESTTRCAVPLFPWLLAVTVVVPRRRARRMTDCPNSPSMLATVGSATLHFTLASLAGIPA